MKKSVKDMEVKNKRVLVRVDFNVPMEKGPCGGRYQNMGRPCPPFRYLLDQGAGVLLVTHLGRPKGKVVPELSVRPLAKHLGSLLGREVFFAGDCGGEESRKNSRNPPAWPGRPAGECPFYAGGGEK